MMKEVGLHEGDQIDRDKSIKTQLGKKWKEAERQEKGMACTRSVTHEEVKPSAVQVRTD